MINLKPTALKTIITSAIFLLFAFIFINNYVNRNSVCKILCTIPNCPFCAYPTSTTEIILWGILTIVIPLLFYLIYSCMQHKK
jgi:uncharacterized RDD family membrane protein YckC